MKWILLFLAVTACGAEIDLKNRDEVALLYLRICDVITECAARGADVKPLAEAAVAFREKPNVGNALSIRELLIAQQPMTAPNFWITNLIRTTNYSSAWKGTIYTNSWPPAVTTHWKVETNWNSTGIKTEMLFSPETFRTNFIISNAPKTYRDNGTVVSNQYAVTVVEGAAFTNRIKSVLMFYVTRTFHEEMQRIYSPVERGVAFWKSGPDYYGWMIIKTNE